MFSVVNVYLDHLKFCVVCINSQRYVCCSECNVVSNECNEPTSCLVQPIGAHSVKICILALGVSFMLTCSMMRFHSLCGVSSPVVVLGLYVRLS